MFDSSTAAVIVSAVLTAGATIIVAIIKLVPAARPVSQGESSPRMETRVAVLENDFRNIVRRLDELLHEIHELRKELAQRPSVGCHPRSNRSANDPPGT